MKETKKISNDIISQQRSILMGISILLIIIFHFTEDCKTFDFHYTGWIRWFKTYVGSSSVDAFLFLSGLGLYYSMKKNPDVRAFYKRRLIKILIPYTIIALPAWFVKDILIEQVGVRAMVEDFTFVSFLSGTKWYWYIAMILVCYLVFPYVFRIVERAEDEIEGEIYFLVLAGNVTIGLILMKLFAEETYSNLELALTRFPIFLAGCFYGRSSYEKRQTYWKWGVIFLMGILALHVLPADMPIVERYARGLCNVSFCALIALFFSKVRLSGLRKMLEWFGTHSLEIYLTHVTVRKIMKDFGWCTCHLRYEFIMVIISLIMAWLLAFNKRLYSDK